VPSEPVPIPAGRRALAALALLGPVVAVAVAVGALRDDVALLAAAIVLVGIAILGGWWALTRTGLRRAAALAVTILAIAGAVAVVLTGDHPILVAAVFGLLAAASVAATDAALGPAAAPVTGTEVGPARHPVLIMNLRSGGGKAERFGLEEECRRRGIEPVVLRPGDDLLQLAADAVARGADVIGMAGGDGSQALVASVAADHDVAHVCIPAGTRNHFALDLGLDRDDVVGALDAFGPARERRIDLATVNDRVFVNNVSLGVYAKIVQSPAYRDAKRQTTTSMLPTLLGPDAPPFDLHFDGPDGRPHDGAQVIQVSNNPYVLTRLGGGFGTRARLDTGTLGVAAVHLTRDSDVVRFVTLESAGQLSRFAGWLEWAPARFEVRSGSPIEAGVDGEALLLEPPLVFESRPGAVRIRIPTHAPGSSPAARASSSVVETARALVDVVRGHQPPVTSP